MNKTLLVMIIQMISLNAFSSEYTSASNPATGVASSIFFGFGSGPIIQQQTDPHTLVYASTQGLGLILLAAGAGGCRNECSSSSKTLAIAGGSLFFASRIVEIVDSSIFSWKYYNAEKIKSTVQLIPLVNGGSLAAVINF